MSSILSKSALALFIFTVAGIAAAVFTMPDKVEPPADDQDAANSSQTEATIVASTSNQATKQNWLAGLIPLSTSLNAS